MTTDSGTVCILESIPLHDCCTSVTQNYLGCGPSEEYSSAMNCSTDIYTESALRPSSSNEKKLRHHSQWKLQLTAESFLWIWIVPHFVKTCYVTGKIQLQEQGGKGGGGEFYWVNSPPGILPVKPLKAFFYEIFKKSSVEFKLLFQRYETTYKVLGRVKIRNWCLYEKQRRYRAIQTVPLGLTVDFKRKLFTSRMALFMARRDPSTFRAHSYSCWYYTRQSCSLSVFSESN